MLKRKYLENFIEDVNLSIKSYFLEYFDFFKPCTELIYDAPSSI